MLCVCMSARFTEGISSSIDFDSISSARPCGSFCVNQGLALLSCVAGQRIEDLLEGRQVDLIVCDMNMLPHMAAVCVEPLLPFLVPGGFVILTCKLMGKGRDRCSPLHLLSLLSCLCLFQVLSYKADT